MQTKVRQLTHSNTHALRVAISAPYGVDVGSTTATFPMPPHEALALVQQAMDATYAAQGGRATGYRSLIALRNKLRDAATRLQAFPLESHDKGKVTAYVTVTS